MIGVIWMIVNLHFNWLPTTTTKERKKLRRRKEIKTRKQYKQHFHFIRVFISIVCKSIFHEFFSPHRWNLWKFSLFPFDQKRVVSLSENWKITFWFLQNSQLNLVWALSIVVRDPTINLTLTLALPITKSLYFLGLQGPLRVTLIPFWNLQICKLSINHYGTKHV